MFNFSCTMYILICLPTCVLKYMITYKPTCTYLTYLLTYLPTYFFYFLTYILISYLFRECVIQFSFLL